eukprot:c28653_g1_i5 orf=351-1235(-)
MTNLGDPMENQNAFLSNNTTADRPVSMDNASYAIFGKPIPKSHLGHHRSTSREDAEFWYMHHEQQASREDNGFRQHLESSIVTPSKESVTMKLTAKHPAGRQVDEPAAHVQGESFHHNFHIQKEANPFRSTDGDVPRLGSAEVGNRENCTSEHPGTEVPYRISGPNQSALNPSYQGRLGKKLGSASSAAERRKSGGTPFAPGTPGRSQPDRSGAALPKFGDWDANNPASAEFTVIFDKARGEKKAGGTVPIPIMSADSSLGMKAEGDLGKQPLTARESSFLSWLCCCFHSSRRN